MFALSLAVLESRGVCKTALPGAQSAWLWTYEEGARKPQGEYSVVIEGCKGRGHQEVTEVTEDVIRRCLELEMAEGASPSAAAKSVASSLGVSRKRVYELSISMKTT